MKQQSAKALAWASLLLLLAAFAIGSPSGAMFLLVMAALCALPGAIFGTRWVRVSAAALLLVAFATGALFFQAFRKDQDTYRRHARERAKVPATAPAETPPAPSK